MAVTAALVTPVVGAVATSVTTASFSPVVGTLLVAFGCARGASAGVPSISDTLGGTWTAIPSSGVNSSLVKAQLWTHVVTVSTARTVTAVAASGTQAALGIVAVVNGDTTNFTNFGSNINGAGDPSVTLSAFQPDSIGLGFMCGNAGAATSTPPVGYAELYDGTAATNLKASIVYDSFAPGTTLAWVSGSTDSIGYGLEIRPATVATADAWNLNDASSNMALSNSDKTATLSTAVTGGVRSTKTYLNGTDTGKYYAEFSLDNTISGNSCQVGIRETGTVLNSSAGSTFQCASSSGSILTGSATTIGNIGGAPLVDGDVVCMAWSPLAERGWFRKNGGLWNNDASADPATNTNGLDISVLNNTDHALLFLAASAINGAIVTIRTELAEFAYTVPSGFMSWMGESASVGGGSVVKAWTGSAWTTEKPVMVWDGSAWVSKPTKIWNGSAWV